MYKHIIILFMIVFYPVMVSADGFVCSTDMNPIVATFEPISYTCASGYFLPADTDVCRPCPFGYSCSGGTYVFNPKAAQGLVRDNNDINHNLNNACDINISHDMAAVFVPNNPDVITVYFSNNGAVETITCDADGELTLPEPPTRVGYTFTGWKVINDD